MFRFKKRG